MKQTIETELGDELTVLGFGVVTHTPELSRISLDKKDGWFIGQKVRVTIESKVET